MSETSDDQQDDKGRKTATADEEEQRGEEKTTDGQDAENLLEAEQSTDDHLTDDPDVILIREDLGTLKAQIEELGDPNSNELGRAKKLIILLSAVTGLVMIISITFFIVMSFSITQKVSELDRVLIAVAKRGVQLGDGLEKISEMESKLVRVIEQNDPIPLRLDTIVSEVSSQSRLLMEKEEENFIALRSRFVPLIEKQNGLESAMQVKFQELEAHVSSVFDLKPLTKENLEIKKQIESLNQKIVEIEGKVNDLYAIKRAEMEQVFIELKNSDE